MESVDGKDLFGNARYLERFKKNGKKKTSERAELLRVFLERLNPAREKMGLRPMAPAYLALIFKGVPTEDLYFLDSVCKSSSNYSKEFWYRVKPRSSHASTVSSSK